MNVNAEVRTPPVKPKRLTKLRRSVLAFHERSNNPVNKVSGFVGQIRVAVGEAPLGDDALRETVRKDGRANGEAKTRPDFTTAFQNIMICSE